MPRILSILFLITIVAYFSFATIEEFVPGFVSDYFNPHLLLIPVVGFLVALLVVEKGAKPAAAPLKTKYSTPLILAAVLVTVGILWLGAQEIPTFWRVLVSVYGGLLVAGILTVLFKE